MDTAERLLRRAVEMLECSAPKVFPITGPELIDQIKDYIFFTKAKESGEQQACWLIERGQKHDHVPTIWWAGEEKPGWPYSGRWTEYANEAAKFSSKQEAEAEAKMSIGQFYEITEHVFISERKD